MSHLVENMRAVGTVSEALAGVNEKRRQKIARAGFDEVMGLGGRLADLVECEVCGLLDDRTPCGDHRGDQ